jgi:hypothetical protein
MIAVRALSLLGVIVMTVAISAAFMTGDFFTEGSEIWSLPWGKVTLIDLYIALALFGAWVAYRETGWIRTVIWWVGLATLGSLAAALYLALAAFSSRDGVELLTGRGQR